MPALSETQISTHNIQRMGERPIFHPPLLLHLAAVTSGACTVMKLITAIIRPFRLEQVRDALMCGGVQGMTVTEVIGIGSRHIAATVGGGHDVDLAPSLKIEVVVDDADAMRLVDTIVLANTIGAGAAVEGGKMFVTSIGHAVRIRTGELDDAAP